MEAAMVYCGKWPKPWLICDQLPGISTGFGVVVGVMGSYVVVALYLAPTR